jgi:hypothetical protein
MAIEYLDRPVTACELPRIGSNGRIDRHPAPLVAISRNARSRTCDKGRRNYSRTRDRIARNKTCPTEFPDLVTDMHSTIGHRLLGRFIMLDPLHRENVAKEHRALLTHVEEQGTLVFDH